MTSTHSLKTVVLATAMGDALGAPFEQILDCEAPLPALDGWRGEYVDGAHGKGVWSDDTGMTRALAESLLAKGGYCLGAVVAAYLRWYGGVDNARVGGTVRAAMEKLVAGHGPETSGVRSFPGGRVGNGTAMRAAPIGFYGAFHGMDAQAVAETAALDASLTHAHPEAQAGSVAVAVAVHALLRGHPRAELAWYVRSILLASGYRWTRVASLLAAVDAASPFSGMSFEAAASMLGRSGDVAETVATAFFCVVMPRLCLSVAEPRARGPVETAVRMRGDTDTRAALTAVLFGASNGIEAFPASWSEGCRDHEALLALDRRLQGVSEDPAVPSEGVS